MSKQKNKVTIREVAQRADVSVATISRVFNDSGLVTEKTRDRIHKIMEQMRYIPNASARSLSRNKTETIGLLLPDLYGEFFSEIIRGADEIAHKEKYHLLVSSSHSNKEELKTAIKMMSGRVDGFIVMSPHLDTDTLLTPQLSLVPTVILGSSVSTSAFKYTSIRIDNIGGAKLVTQHLIELGHRRIAIIKGDLGNEDADGRLAGYLAMLKNAKIKVIDEYIVNGDFTEHTGYRAAQQLLSMRKRPTAIFASNDEMAIGVLRCLRENKVSVPGEIAVAGFDDIQIANLIHPSLTTVHVNISEVGSLAVEQLFIAMKRTNGNQYRKTIVLPAQLIVRESTLV
jgi:LacI family transcriptional regulator